MIHRRVFMMLHHNFSVFMFSCLSPLSLCVFVFLFHILMSDLLLKWHFHAAYSSQFIHKHFVSACCSSCTGRQHFNSVEIRRDGRWRASSFEGLYKGVQSMLRLDGWRLLICLNRPSVQVGQNVCVWASTGEYEDSWTIFLNVSSRIDYCRCFAWQFGNIERNKFAVVVQKNQFWNFVFHVLCII